MGVLSIQEGPKKGGSMKDTMTSTYNQNKKLVQGIGKAIVLIGILKYAADYSQNH